MPSDIAQGIEPGVKRRKVRKGTRNCWECKRRKVRCIFDSSSSTSCKNCVQRKATCVSQEYVEEPVPQDAQMSSGVEGRLCRVEDLLEQLIQNGLNHPEGTPRAPTLVAPQPYSDLSSNSTSTIEALPTSGSLLQESNNFTILAQDLLAVWPCQDDLDLIYNLPAGLSAHSHGKFCVAFSGTHTRDTISPLELLDLPPPKSHPVLIAQKLLFLGSLLQAALSASLLPEKSRHHFHDIMTRAIEAAVKLVNTNDEFVMSIEGIECIVIESMLHNYAGLLHRSWLVIQRAAAVAQMVGLHRYPAVPNLKILNQKVKTGYDSAQLCIRIFEMDCYLSLILGLPKSSFKIRALSDDVLATSKPLDRMAYLQHVTASHILERDIETAPEAIQADLCKMDRMLQRAAAVMPPQWWLVPTFGSRDRTSEAIQDMTRIFYQSSHYHLVLRVHLPYMTRPSEAATHNYSRITAVNASREMLARYFAFRACDLGQYYCRGTDYLALIALTVLCLAHIDPWTASTSRMSSDLDFKRLLAQSRLSDRGMMERTVQILNNLKDDDAIATKLTRIMQDLLDIEAEAASGVIYTAVSAETKDGRTDCVERHVGGKKSLQLHLPHFATIDLQRRPAPASDHAQLSDGNPEKDGAANNTFWSDQMFGLNNSLSNSELVEPTSATPQVTDPGTDEFGTQDAVVDDLFDDWTLQNINGSLFGSLLGSLDQQGDGFNLWPS